MIQLRVGRQTLDIDLDAAIEVNNKLSAQYKAEADPERRREIISILYRLNLPLFRKWKIFNFEDKRDYEQEAFFFVSRALEKFQPGRGAFLHFLKQYYVKESQRQYSLGKAKLRNISESIENAGFGAASGLDGERDVRWKTDEEGSDALFWRDASALLGEDTWEIVHGCIFGGMTPTDIARQRQQPQRTVNYKYNRGLETLRTLIAKRMLKAGPAGEKLGEGEWVGPKKFCRILEISPNYLKDLLNPNRPASVCPLYINPLHFLPLQGGRIRYLFTTDRGMVYPELIRKKTA